MTKDKKFYVNYICERNFYANIKEFTKYLLLTGSRISTSRSEHSLTNHRRLNSTSTFDWLELANSVSSRENSKKRAKRRDQSNQSQTGGEETEDDLRIVSSHSAYQIRHINNGRLSAPERRHAIHSGTTTAMQQHNFRQNCGPGHVTAPLGNCNAQVLTELEKVHRTNFHLPIQQGKKI